MEVQVMVGLQRTACFGRCPVYELSVLNTGEATLKVGRFCDEAFGRSLAEGCTGRGRRGHVAHEGGFGLETWASTPCRARYDNPKVMDLPANIVTVMGTPCSTATADLT